MHHELCIYHESELQILDSKRERASLSGWIGSLIQRQSRLIALRQRRPSLVVGWRNKAARIAWAVMSQEENYQRVPGRLNPPNCVLQLARE
jgi:hypothetical protein